FQGKPGARSRSDTAASSDRRSPGGAKIAGRDRYSCGGTKAGRLDHERKRNFRSVFVRCCFFGGRAGRFDETKEVIAGIFGITAHFGMLERSVRGRKNCR